MTGQDLIDAFSDLVDDDNTGTDRALEILNTAYDALNTERLWNFLRSEDTSITLTGSTLSYAVPSKFLYLVRVYRYNASADTFTEMTVIPMQEKTRYYKVNDTIYVDFKNQTLNLTNTPTNQNISGQVLYVTFQYQPDQLTLTTSPVYNRAFHKILVYEMAKIFWYMDQQDKQRSFNGEMQGEYNLLKQKMIRFDNNSEFSTNPTNEPDLSWVPSELS